MELIKKIIKTIFSPHIIFVMIIFPLSLVFMACSLLFLGTESIVTYISYGLAFYSLLVLSLRIPKLYTFFKNILNTNKLYIKYKQDLNFRITITLITSLILNIIYTIFQLCLGLYHKSFWYISMAVYYGLLSLLRVYLLKYASKNKLGENILLEYKKYQFCGWIMLLLNIVVTTIMFFIIYFDRTFYHHQVTTIALAAYTFITFSLSIYNFIKYRKVNSPVYFASKAINLVTGCVSMITLTTTMLTTFGEEDIIVFKKYLLLGVGIVVSLFILVISIQIIVFTKLNINKENKKYIN